MSRQQQCAIVVDPILEMLKSKRKANYAGPIGQLKPLEDTLLRHVFEQREQGITVHVFNLVAKASSLSPEFNTKHFILKPYVAIAWEHVIPLLILDSYHCHMMASVVTRIQELRIEVKHIPGGCTSLCLSWKCHCFRCRQQLVLTT